MKIFISYSRKDKDLLEKLYPQITATYPNDKIWYDKDLQGGEDWWKSIVTQISECDIFLLLVSPDSITSRICQEELQEAIERDKAILPVCIRLSDDDIDNMPGYLSAELKKTHYIDIIEKLGSVDISS